MSPRYSTYCIHSGLSRLNCARSWAAVAGSGARSPNIALTGSPTAYTITKIRNVVPRNTGTIWSSRLMT
jgi:hypothetical protein